MPAGTARFNVDIPSDQPENVVMRTIGAAKFKEQCLALLDELDEDGIVVTKRGRPIARVLPIHERENNDDLIGSLKGILRITGDVEGSIAEWAPDDPEP